MGGTRGGDGLTLVLDESGKLVAANVERFGVTVAHTILVNDPFNGPSVLTTCDGRVCLQSRLDERKAAFKLTNMVWVVDAADTSKVSPFITNASVLQGGLPGRKDKTQILFTSRTRLMLAELHPQPGPVQRILPLCGTPVRVIYSHMLGCLVVAVNDLENKTTLQFLDADTGEDISMPTDKSGQSVEFVAGLGKAGDQILGLGEWHYERDGDKWVFLLVSTKRGRSIVLSTARIEAEAEGQRARIKYWTRYKKPRMGQPVYSVVGWNNSMFSCVGSTIFWDKIETEERRLNTYRTFELSSFATSLRIVNRKLIALTDHDSLEIIDIREGNEGDMSLHHADSESRAAVHAIEIGTTIADGELDTSLLLVSDRNSTAAGLWVPWRQPGRDCSVVFEAELPVSVRRFARGRTRPSWQQARRDVRYGLVPSTPDAAEILGVCLDGSMQHFTLLSIPIWRILRLVQKLALGSPLLYPYIYDEWRVEDVDTEPLPHDRAAMHVDGDMLQRCLDRRAVESIFSDPEVAAQLFRLLDALDNGRWTAAFKARQPSEEAQHSTADGQNPRTVDEMRGDYFALLYDILEYYMAPVM